MESVVRMVTLTNRVKRMDLRLGNSFESKLSDSGRYFTSVLKEKKKHEYCTKG